MRLTFACLILGLPLMLLFEYPLTRIAGVLLCLGFPYQALARRE